MEETRVRFAPSPTGYLHVGGARTALFNWLFAKKTGGKFILRIEDTDRSRYNENALDEIFTSLRWLGLQWDEGAEIGGEYGSYFQSERLSLYKKYADELIEKGLAYRCFCSQERLESLRQEQEKTQKGVFGYDKKCRNLSKEESDNRAKNEKFVIRLSIPENRTVKFVDKIRGEISFDTNTQDDFVLLKTDGFPTYHLANVIDDHFMKITDVLRGDEWITSTPKHVLLYEAFGWKTPNFAHLPVILSEDGSKLSKRKGAASVMDYKKEGILPDALKNFLALLGWNPGDDREIMSVEEMIEAFSLEKVNPKASVFDNKKLNWMNGEYLKKTDDGKIYEELKEEFDKLSADKEKIFAAISFMKERTQKIIELPNLCAFFFFAPKIYDEQTLQKVKKDPNMPDILSKLSKILSESQNFDSEICDKILQDLVAQLAVGFGKVGLPARLAITGLGGGPSLHDIMPLIGKDECVKRIDKFLGSL
ncbi:MAG: glutamate--tRNA ligase [Chitinivibrionia bacterium]|nr:glutamate--tRNA ligase [Chitinivibrionia bacterium]